MNKLLTLNSISVIHKNSEKKLIEDISFSVNQGRTLAIVGESGCGKSLLSKVIMGLLPETLQLSGEVYLEKKPIEHQSLSQRRALLGTTLGVIVQNGMSAFDPLMTIGKQFSQTLIYHFSLNKKQAEAQTRDVLSHIFPTQYQTVMRAYPNQL